MGTLHGRGHCRWAAIDELSHWPSWEANLIGTSLLCLADTIRDLSSLLGEKDQRIVAGVISHTTRCLRDVAEEGDDADPEKIRQITALANRLIQVLEEAVMLSPPGSRH